jgi:lysophospholipase L1-like esterase
LTRIRCVGDSITFGQHLEFGAEAWPARVGGEGRGVCGETTRQALERFPRDVQDDPADVTVLQWGHNDANRWDTDNGLPRVSRQAFEANLVEMIDRCRVFNTRPVLCTLTPTSKNDLYDCDVKAYSRIVRMVAAINDVDLVDVRTAFFDAADLDLLLMDDGLHLTEEGHDLYAQTVAHVLSPVTA